METIILKDGLIIDPTNNIDMKPGDIWVQNGKIVKPGSQYPENTLIFDLDGKWIVPGLIDMHVHLREPGEEYKETIASGTQAAAAGGFTAVACMPNTHPVNDTGSVTRYILETAANCDARVYPVGAISKKSTGDSLAEYGEMKEAGAVALSDDGMPVMNSQLMRRAMEYSKSYGMPIISHSEEPALSRNGCMNEGDVSTKLGLKGIPAAAEAIMVYREIALCELTGVPIHIAHVSTAQSLQLIRSAKGRGVRVTAETAPHYLTITDEAVMGYDTNAKMNPPLRTALDREEMRRALSDGTLDAIATDHAPHSILEKEVEFNRAANGILGLETALPLALRLVHDNILTPSRMVELLSVNPAKILKVHGGTLSINEQADITVIDPDLPHVYSKESIVSKSTNSPFIDWQFQGKAVLTIMGGRITNKHLA